MVFFRCRTVLAHALVTRWRRPRASARKSERWASLRSLFLSVRRIYTPARWRTPDGKSANDVAEGTSRATTESLSALSRGWSVKRSPTRPARRGRSVKRSRSLSARWTEFHAETLSREGETSAGESALFALCSNAVHVHGVLVERAKARNCRREKEAASRISPRGRCLLSGRRSSHDR